MSFDVAADDYQRFMGRWSEPLGELLVTSLAPVVGQRALDVGSGPGAVTGPLVRALGAAAVTAVDPSESFAAALRVRLPGVDVRVGRAESLDLADDSFDLVTAQLVVNFLTDPQAGLAELARVLVPGGTIAASVWDFEGERAPLSLFWRGARDLDPSVAGEHAAPGAQAGSLARLFSRAGLTRVRAGELTVEVPWASYREWWQPYTLGVGPAGAYLASLDPAHRDELRRHLRTLVPVPGPVRATAWVAYGSVD